MQNEEVKTTETQVVEDTNAERPKSAPIVPIGPGEARLFGRKVIYADYEEHEMNEETIAKILNDVFSVHIQNASEIDYL